MTAFLEKKGCSSCDRPKDEECGISPAVLQINNPSECVLFHKVEIPASMGNEITIPPDPGKYRNVILYYEASGNAYIYTSDGMPILISYTDYLRLTNKPSINGVTLAGDKTLAELGINDAVLTVKQNGTVLGTFSANANEDVEINVSDSHTQALSVTLQYDGSDIRTWSKIGQGLIFRIENGDAAGWVEDREVPEGFSFINDATSAPVSLDDILAALDADEEVIFNGFPVGAFLDTSDEEIYFVPVNGMRVSSKQSVVEEGSEVKEYYSTTLVAMPEGTMVPAGFKLAKYTYTIPEESTSYSLIVQCINGANNI